MMKPRVLVAALSVSAAAFGALVTHEAYTDKAVIPTKGDRPTVGFGSTFDEKGAPVRMGDTITPVQAVQRSLAHIAKDETRLKSCVTAPLSQGEYDVLVSFAYQYGSKVACESSVVRLINAQRYAEACDAYLLYKRAAGYDCSTLIDGEPNKRCWGVWERSLWRQRACLEAQP